MCIFTWITEEAHTIQLYHFHVRYFDFRRYIFILCSLPQKYLFIYLPSYTCSWQPKLDSWANKLKRLNQCRQQCDSFTTGHNLSKFLRSFPSVTLALAFRTQMNLLRRLSLHGGRIFSAITTCFASSLQCAGCRSAINSLSMAAAIYFTGVHKHQIKSCKLRWASKLNIERYFCIHPQRRRRHTAPVRFAHSAANFCNWRERIAKSANADSEAVLIK